MPATAPSPIPSFQAHSPENCPFETVIIDITHRCNMACRNCYIPNRQIPDLSAEWVGSMIRRLPRGTNVRFVGAEPTLHPDLPWMIAEARRSRMHPVVLSNGLRLADRAYLRELKTAGLRVMYLSLNGGFDDDLYEAIDDLRCADRKRAALENLRAEHMYTSLGMIIVRGVNEGEPAKVLRYIRSAPFIRELHLRSVGAIGRHIATIEPLTLGELAGIWRRAAGGGDVATAAGPKNDSHMEIRSGRLRVQLTVWPELGSSRRGRLTPEGMIEPFFEHVLQNEGGY